jgi:hypothetical protein
MANPRRQAGVLAPHVEDYRAWLARHGYTGQTIRNMLKDLGQDGLWLSRQGLDLGFNQISGRISTYHLHSLICATFGCCHGMTRPFPSCWVLRDIHNRKETAVPSTLPCPGAGLQTLPEVPAPDPAVFTGAVARYQALAALEEFRLRLHGCLAARAGALFDLADAVLCADHAVTSLVQLSLEPEFRRGHGALYDALAAGRVDDERLFSLLTEVLTPLVDGPEARAWIAGHDVIDRGMLDRALSGLPAAQAAQVRDACARWDRVRVAIDATGCPRPRAECSPGREHVRNGACHCKGSSKTAPGWEYQLAAVTGHLRTAWAAVIDVRRTTPATRTAQTIAQARTVVRRLRATGAAGPAVPLLIFDAGYSAAALADGLAGYPARILVRLPAGSAYYADAVAWPGKNGRPAHRGIEVHCLEQEDIEAAAAGQAPGDGRSRYPRAPSPTRPSSCPAPRSTAPSAPRPGMTSTPAPRRPPIAVPSGASLSTDDAGESTRPRVLIRVRPAVADLPQLIPPPPEPLVPGDLVGMPLGIGQVWRVPEPFLVPPRDPGDLAGQFGRQGTGPGQPEASELPGAHLVGRHVLNNGHHPRRVAVVKEGSSGQRYVQFLTAVRTVLQAWRHEGDQGERTVQSLPDRGAERSEDLAVNLVLKDLESFGAQRRVQSFGGGGIGP